MRTALRLKRLIVRDEHDPFLPSTVRGRDLNARSVIINHRLIDRDSLHLPCVETVYLWKQLMFHAIDFFYESLRFIKPSIYLQVFRLQAVMYTDAKSSLRNHILTLDSHCTRHFTQHVSSGCGMYWEGKLSPHVNRSPGCLVGAVVYMLCLAWLLSCHGTRGNVQWSHM